MHKTPLPLPKDMQAIRHILSIKNMPHKRGSKAPMEQLFERCLEIEEEEKKSGYWGTPEWRAMCEKWKTCYCIGQCDCYMN